MEKEKVTEELVRQNGNQAAAVMADYAGQGGGGSTGGIPTIDKNIQPNIVWRKPTAEDLAKFHARHIAKVADLTEGKLPLLLKMQGLDSGVELFSVISITSPLEGEDGEVYVTGDNSFLLSEDWTLLGVQGMDNSSF